MVKVKEEWLQYSATSAGANAGNFLTAVRSNGCSFSQPRLNPISGNYEVGERETQVFQDRTVCSGNNPGRKVDKQPDQSADPWVGKCYFNTRAMLFIHLAHWNEYGVLL